MLAALLLVLIQPLAGLASGLDPAQEVEDLTWRDIELGPGLVLDLRLGRLRTGERGEDGCLGLDEGVLWAQPSLARWSWSGGQSISRRVVRGGGEQQAPAKAEVGAEYLYDLGLDGWGYLRVLAAEPDWVRIEWALAGEENALERVPATLSVAPEPSGHRLHWSAREGAEYLVLRRLVGAGDEEVAARVTGGGWFDGTTPMGTLVEYRVALAQPKAFGARMRVVRQVHPGEWPLELRVGQTLNLLTGDLGRPGAHLEVTHLSANNVTWRVIGAAQLADLPAMGGDLPWEVPSVESGKYTNRLRSVSASAELAFHLPATDIYGRLQLVPSADQGLALLRQVDLEGGHLLPRPPQLDGVVEWSSGSLSMRFVPELKARAGMQIAVELESEYLSGSWVEAGVFPAGSPEVSVPVHSAEGRLVRVRARHRLVGGTQSLAGSEHACLLLDLESPSDVQAALDRAIADLGHGEFARRREARGALSLLGPLAWPRLQAALTGSDAEVVASCRELLLDAEGDGGQHLELVLRARAMDIQVQSEPPAGLFALDPGERAQVLLAAWAQSPDWVRVLALGDPDANVRELAQVMSQAPHLPPVMTGSPRDLLADARPSHRSDDWRGLVLDHGPRGLANLLRSSSFSGESRVELAWLRLACDLDTQSEGAWLGPGGAAESAELVLRLLDQYLLSKEPALLRAAEVMVSGPAATLGAERELLSLHLDAREPNPGSREQVVLEVADLGLLELRLGSMLEAGARDVDVILPAGIYSSDDEGSRWLDLRVPGLRLIAEGEVRIEAGLRLQDVQRVVLQGIHVLNRNAAAMVLADASATALDCEFVGSQSVITLQKSELELDRCRIAPLPNTQGIYSLRFSGGSGLRARATRIHAGSLYLGDRGQAYLDRCVLEAGSRSLVQAQQDGVFVARDCLLLGSALGIYGVEEGLLEGVVLRVGQDPLGRGGENVRFCAEHTRYSGVPSTRSVSGEAIPVCPVRTAQPR